MTTPAVHDGRIGRRTPESLGGLVNVVERPSYPCPRCGDGGPMEVHRFAVRWPCGHTRDLPRGVPR